MPKSRATSGPKSDLFTYKLTLDGLGVIRSDGAFIPDHPTSYDWKRYLDWLSEDNTPDPAETAQETADRLTHEEIHDLKDQLSRLMVHHNRILHEVWRLLKLGTDITNADMRPAVLSRLHTHKQKLDRLQEIDE